MVYWLALVAVIIVGLAHWIDGRVNPKAYFFLPFLFLAPSLTTIDLSNSLGGFGVALVMGGSIAAYIGDKAGDKVKDDRDKKRMAKLAAVGFGATIAGALFTYLDQIKSDNKNEAAQTKITSLGEKNVQLSEENRALLRENTNLLTGGDSLFYLDLKPEFPSGRPRADFAVLGRYDIPEVKLQIDDFTRAQRERAAGTNEDHVDSVSRNVVDVGSVSADTSLYLTRLTYPSKGEGIVLAIAIIQRKHVATQFVSIRHFEDGSYAFASRFYRVQGHERGRILLKLLPQFSKDDPRIVKDAFGKTPFVDYPNLIGSACVIVE